ncbi:MAG: hypothetical protein QOC78_729 [Solirubrobacteraceae bacterium]|nr:hypothetical protein [Solirubrobacteraceae bacterium]
MFPGHDRRPWTLTAYQNWRRRTYTPAAAAAGVERPRPYDLRHSFVSLLIAEGHNVVEVARQAGHSPKMALDTYAHVFEEFDPAERINAADRIRSAREELRFRERQPTLFDVARAPRSTPTPSCVWPRASCCGGASARPRPACALQPRDLEILVALARYRFLTTGQIAELWWEGRGLRAGAAA